MSEELDREFEALDEGIAELERRVADGSAALEAVLPACMDAVRRLLVAYAAAKGKTLPAEQDLLAVFKAFVKGDPSLNAARDNVRELVYYRNCLDLDRQDALPAKAARMAVRTARHIHLYLSTRLLQERRRDSSP